MGGYKVHRNPSSSSLTIEDVWRAGEPRCQSLCRSFSPPEVANRVAKFIVPLGPTRRKCSDLIAPRPAIPRLGDQFHFAQDGILAARFEKAALVIEAVRFPRQNRTEIETETVDVHLFHPIT